MPKKITRAEIVAATGIDDREHLSFRGGVFAIRRGYYWRPRITPEEMFAPVLENIKASGFVLGNIEYGDKMTAFRGDAPLRDSSHYWVRFTCERTLAKEPTP